MWTHITPQLNVPDLEAGLDWYRVHVGCRIAWRSEDRTYGALYNGTTEIFLCQSDESTSGSVLCIRVPDVDAVHAAALEAETPIAEPLADRPWRMREFEIRDPWGHRLRIGTSLLV